MLRSVFFVSSVFPPSSCICSQDLIPLLTYSLQLRPAPGRILPQRSVGSCHSLSRLHQTLPCFSFVLHTFTVLLTVVFQLCCTRWFYYYDCSLVFSSQVSYIQTFFFKSQSANSLTSKQTEIR